jgi:Na+-driven multidrug efflux pump
MPIFAMGVAMETFTGQCLGARNVERVFKFFRAATVQMIIVVVILGLAVFLGGEYFAQLFTRDENVLRAVHGIWYGILIGYVLGAILAYWQLSAKKWLAKQV